MSNPRLIEPDDLEDLTHRLLGRFFVAFARVELNLSLRVGPDGSFGTKLVRFFEAAHLGPANERFYEMVAWYMAADSAREFRNCFAHGRWGFINYTQTICHVSGYPPNPQSEMRFSLAQLDAIVSDTELLGSEICPIAYE